MHARSQPIYLTLTTDLGSDSHYAAILKGLLLKNFPFIHIIDITHQIPRHDLVQASWTLKNSYTFFPKNTIHVCLVAGVTPVESLIYYEINEIAFILPDNGILNLLFDSLDYKIYHHAIDIQKRNSLYLFHSICFIIESVINNYNGLQEIPVNKQIHQTHLRPIHSTHSIKGLITLIDSYGNAITNIHQSLFHTYGPNRPFRIIFSRFAPIQIIHQHYTDVELGLTCCLFNGSGFLEIAVNGGSAAIQYHLHISDLVQIDFT